MSVRSLLQKIPVPLKTRLVAVANAVSELRPRRRAYRRWVRESYTPHVQQLRKQLFLSVASFAHINRPIGGAYFEFGCNEANTMRLAWDNFHHLFDWRYVGFDSFEGLPEIEEIDRQAIWAKGKLKIDEQAFRDICEAHGMPREALVTVKGFYSDSLNDQARKRLGHLKAAVIYVDCDLYHSTVPVLEFCRAYLQVGTVIIFDDWNCFCGDPERGERRAWREFCERFPNLHFEPFIYNGAQASFICTKPDKK